MRYLPLGSVGVSRVLVAAAGAAAVVLAAGAAAAALLAVGDGTKLQTAATSTLPYFQDVDEGSVHAANIERAGELGIAVGTSVSSSTADGVTTRTFSPSEPVSRGQMATFLTRTWRAAGQECPSTGFAYFDDVASGSSHAAGIDCMSALRVARGTADRMFSPSEPVSRGQMATFMTRAWMEAGRTCPANTDSSFSDVAESSTHAAGINCMAALRVARGTTAGTFSPSEPVSRGQMATFLVRFYDALSDAS